MGLPTQAIERLFQRLAATYGAAWDRSLGAAPLADVKTAWNHELSGFGGRLDDIAWALENLPDRPPNVIEFKKLCRMAPATETPQLPAPPADPERLKAELAKLGKIVNKPRHDDKEWARIIVKRAEAGDPIRPYNLNLAKQALRNTE